ncbi:MAG: hypothetical protein KGV44_08940 [Flavobacteriaceae bacterium]|nr:hypothetical protein [Flavobacteriaceae bacterium]
MVRKLLILFFSIGLISSFTSCKGTDTMRDYFSLELLIIDHKSIHKDYVKVRNKEIVKLGLESKIKNLQKEVTELDQKIAKRYTDVVSVISAVGKLKVAWDIIKDIKKYQESTIKEVEKNPKLIGLALKSEIAILKKIKRLKKYILQIPIGGKINLMSIKQRLTLAERIITELRVIRGMSYGVYRHLYYAQKGDLFEKYLNEFNLKSYTLDEVEKHQSTKDLIIW